MIQQRNYKAQLLISEQDMASTYLGKHGRTLIDAMFHQQDQKLLEEFHDRLTKRDRREQLSSLCNINDDALLDHMVELDLQPEVIAAIAVVPLVVVAWADGIVQPGERAAILQAAESSGVTPQDGGYPMLERWLGTKPGPEILDAWKLYIAALCKQLSDAEIEELKRDLLGRVDKVAKAAGGILGITSKVSDKEHSMMKTLERAFVKPA